MSALVSRSSGGKASARLVMSGAKSSRNTSQNSLATSVKDSA